MFSFVLKKNILCNCACKCVYLIVFSRLNVTKPFYLRVGEKNGSKEDFGFNSLRKAIEKWQNFEIERKRNEERKYYMNITTGKCYHTFTLWRKEPLNLPHNNVYQHIIDIEGEGLGGGGGRGGARLGGTPYIPQDSKNVSLFSQDSDWFWEEVQVCRNIWNGGNSWLEYFGISDTHW